MLTIIRALEEYFLEGATHLVEIWTDHKNLEYFMTAKKLNCRQACWSLHLARFNFLLHHHPRRTMGKPDTLSRRADHRNGASDNENIVLLRPEFLVVRALEGVELTGVEQKILSNICKGNWNRDQEEPIAKAARELWSSANEAVHSEEWSNIDGCKGTTLGQCLVMWVGSHLRAAISPIAFPCLSYFPFCTISCDSSKTIIGHSVNICQVPWERCLDDLVV